MKVSELIVLLSTMNPDALIITRGYEGGVTECESIYPCTVALNVNTAWYYGEHELLHDGSSTDYSEFEQVPGVKL